MNGKLLIEMRNGVAGFFTEEELAAGKGIVYSPRDLEDKKRRAVRKDVGPYVGRPARARECAVGRRSCGCEHIAATPAGLFPDR